jgi:D-serine deaminase-like pyridoxal phosphate-dependent protein
VGEKSKEVKLVVSTVAEAEHLLPYLLECQQSGETVNVLYGVPLPPSQAPRLGRVASQLGSRSVSVIIDDEDQLDACIVFKDEAGFPIQLYVKIDTGYHRAGISPSTSRGSKTLRNLFKRIELAESRGVAELVGFYSHSGHSYHKNNELDIMEILVEEITRFEPALNMAKSIFTSRHFTISIGATPSTTSIQNLLSPAVSDSDMGKKMARCIDMIREYGELELHAGVYPLLDEQQLATHARPDHDPDSTSKSLLSHKDIALTIIAEICSVYNDRSPPEALIAAGSLALGREPCPSYRGWGVLTNWGMENANTPGLEHSGLILDRISQEHGIVAREGPENVQEPLNLKAGQKVRIWPNHACIAGVGYGWYLVTDSNKENKDEIVDVWVRWRGW